MHAVIKGQVEGRRRAVARYNEREKGESRLSARRRRPSRTPSSATADRLRRARRREVELMLA